MSDRKGTAMGRASFPIEAGTTPTLPRGVTLVSTVEMPLKGETWAIVEGQGLPPWSPGSDPWHYRSLDDLMRQWGPRSP